MPTIGTWNMQGANDAKWLTIVKSYMTTASADAICLQECGAQPASASAQPAVQAITNNPHGEVVVPASWKIGTAGRNLYMLVYNWPQGGTPGSRCNLAIVCSVQPVQWWVVWASSGPEWRPAIGATLPGGQVVFSMHAISPGGPDALWVVAGIASVVSQYAGNAPWYVGGDYNREPTTWTQVNVSPPSQPTYSTAQPVSRYDYLVSSNAANTNNVGQRLDESGPWSDHFLVHFAGLQ